MERQFLSLRQKEDENVAKYEANFTRLARHAADYIRNPRSKIDRFFDGLKPFLRRALVSQSFSSYEDIVSCAIKTEKEFSKSYDNKVKQEKKRTVEQETDKGKKGKKDFPLCDNCGKNHPGTCLKGMGVCYKCGEKGHQARDCKGKKEAVKVECYNCREMGHYANE